MPEATNTPSKSLGKPAGYIVFLGDAWKAVFAVWIVRYLLFPGLGDVTKILETVTALGVVLGHNYPFYMHFKGGKGIAATGGFMFALDVRIALIAAIVFAVVFFTTRYVSVGSFVQLRHCFRFCADLLSWTVGGVWTQSDIHGTGLVAASGEY